jgi:hypothetical protein
MNIDLINGGFELCSGLFQIANILRLIKDKEVKGVSLSSFILYTVWGLWNLYYYPSLGQSLSFIGGIFIVVTNMIWLGLAIYYKQFNIK